MTDDRALQKQIAADAQVDPAPAASPLVRFFQFFLVPMIIVAACVGIYALLNLLVSNPRSAQDWLVDIKEGGPSTRNYASLQLAQTLRRMDSPDRTLTLQLVESYKSTDPKEYETRRYLLKCLGYLRDPRACDLLLDVAQNPQESHEFRSSALDALGTIKSPDTLPALVKLLDDREDLVRKYAAFNAGAVAEQTSGESRAGAVDALKRRLSDSAADVTWNAAFALAFFLNDRSGTDTLKQMLDREYLAGKIDRKDVNVHTLYAHAQIMACNAAAKLKDGSFLPRLRTLTDDKIEPSPEVRFKAHQAIAKIQEK